MLEEQQEHARDLLQATADKEVAAETARNEVCRVEVQCRGKLEAKAREAQNAVERLKEQLSKQKADAAQAEAQRNQEHTERIQRERQRLEGALEREREEACVAAEQAKRLLWWGGGRCDR